MSPDRQRALEALDRPDESAAARVFAARRRGGNDVLPDAMVAYARRRSRLYFAPPPACEREVRRLCRAAREQGVDVDPERVLASAVADSREVALERARAIRDRPGLAAAERERRLSELLAAARAAGFDVDRDTLRRDRQCADRPAGASHSGDDHRTTTDGDTTDRRSLPPAETLTSWLVSAKRNRIRDWPTRGD